MIFLTRETLISLHIFFQLGQQGPAHGLTLLLLSGSVHLAFFILDAKHGTLTDFLTVEILNVTPRKLLRQVYSI